MFAPTVSFQRPVASGPSLLVCQPLPKTMHIQYCHPEWSQLYYEILQERVCLYVKGRTITSYSSVTTVRLGISLNPSRPRLRGFQRKQALKTILAVLQE